MGKASPERTNRRGTSVKNYATRVFQESTVGTVSVIASTSSKRRKFFKAFVLIVCFTGFFYQSIKFLTVVFTYPTNVDVEIKRPSSFNVPAYTFCNNNGIKRSLFCKKYPQYCEEEDDDDTLCKEFGLYCDENKTLVPKEQYYKTEKFLTYEEFIEVSGELKDFLLSHGKEEDPEGPLIRLRDMEQHSWMTCYSLNGRVNSSLLPRQTGKNILIKVPVNSFEFQVDKDEMFIPGSWPGVVFSIHSPFEGVNPFEKGIFLKPGRTYVIRVSMEEELLLKNPYETDCLNYTEIWEDNGRTGPRMQDMCRHKCSNEYAMKCYNCAVPIFLYPTHEKLCSNETDNEDSDDDYDDEAEAEKCLYDSAHEFEKCYDSCKDDCHRTKYHYIVQERPTIKADMKNFPEKKVKNSIFVKVYLEDDEVIILKHTPKYMVVEVFGTIGGFIGGWLGISLLEVTDIFEGFVRITRYSLKRR